MYCSQTCFPPPFINTSSLACVQLPRLACLEVCQVKMESDLKRIARLEYLKLRQCKQTEKTEAVKVRFWTIEKCEMKQLSLHVNFEDPLEVYYVTRVTHYHQKVRLIILLMLLTLGRKFWVISQSGNSNRSPYGINSCTQIEYDNWAPVKN